jgi:hypothetical protein
VSCRNRRSPEERFDILKKGSTGIMPKSSISS